MIEERIRLLCEGAKEKLPVRRITRKTGEPYLDRYYLLGRVPKYFPQEIKPVFGFLPFTVFLHHFLASDEESAHHNHPWDVSRSLILAGSYIEERLVMDDNGNRNIHWNHLKPGNVNVIRSEDFHRVDLSTPDVWTLFMTGTKSQTWGFVEPADGIFQHWKGFVARGRVKPNDPIHVPLLEADLRLPKEEFDKKFPSFAKKPDRDRDGDFDSSYLDHTYG
jgi:hypothetical protein